MTTPHVLIVDDDLALLQALPEALKLRMEEIVIDTCDNANAALDRIAKIDYDAIVSDIKMPGMDGLTLLSKIRTLRPDTPTLLITGHGEHDLAMQALRGGAYDFIQKPIDRDYFIASLSRAIRTRQLDRQVEQQQAALERYANELEQIVEERTRELREANRLKDEFLATLSHELRTPLTAILGWIRMLRAGKLDAATHERALETIERNAKSQTQLIEDLLDVSRIITGKLRLDVHFIELSPVIDSAIDAVRPAAEAKEIKLRKVLDTSANHISGDPNRLQQVVWNLLSNAIKFTPPGGQVEVKTVRADSSVEIRIIDTGKGIQPELLPHVFERFRQGDSSSTRVHGGLGLGLAIVRHLVELHGGAVSAHSDGENKGATFVVRLPLPVMRADMAARRIGPQAGIGEDFLRPKLAGLRVLIVDDESDTCEMLITVLNHYGAEVQAKSSAADAFEAVRSWRPDVLVSDIGMPGEDGYDLIGKIRALDQSEGGRTPAVALTAYARVEDRLRLLAAGFQMHLPKPVEPAELAAVVASLARRPEKLTEV